MRETKEVDAFTAQVAGWFWCRNPTIILANAKKATKLIQHFGHRIIIEAMRDRANFLIRKNDYEKKYKKQEEAKALPPEPKA